jgi:dihydropteroate synthase
MKVMGIINCTPDSFSDGGVFFDVPSALDQVSDFLKMGVDYIDVGGQSIQ